MRHSRRFHLTLQVADFHESVLEYSEILGERPCCIITGRLALWRTKELNFLLRAKSQQRTAVLQMGWEYDYLDKTQRFKDRNLLSWLFFSTGTQDEAINRLNTELEYDENSDFLLELHNPNARWNLWISGVLILAMGIFTLLNRAQVQDFFRPQIDDKPEVVQESMETLLQKVGQLLGKNGYTVSYLNSYAIAQHPKQASITFQIVHQQVLFSTYWALEKTEKGFVAENINAINREAIFCRYYVDEQEDLAVEAWFSIHFENEEEWQRILQLWQQESFRWIQDSPLFGGDLQPKQSFSKQ